MRDVMNILMFAVGLVLVILLFLYAGVAVIQRLAFPGTLAAIEQLRGDALTVDSSEAEDVIGQVTEFNQNIAAQKAFNRTWWAGPLTPDGWDEVKPIPVPTR